MKLPGNSIVSTGKCTNKPLIRKALVINGDLSQKSF